MASYWAEQAAKALAEDYSPGNIYENRLRHNLEEIKPELYQELLQKGDLDNYLIAQVHSAQSLYLNLLEAGTNPFQAREAMQQQLADLLRTKEDEEEENPALS